MWAQIPLSIKAIDHQTFDSEKEVGFVFDHEKQLEFLLVFIVKKGSYLIAKKTVFGREQNWGSVFDRERKRV